MRCGRGIRQEKASKPDLLAQFQFWRRPSGGGRGGMADGGVRGGRRAGRRRRSRLRVIARVERVIICTPDKDLAQCVRGTRVVQLIRRTRVIWTRLA